MACKNEGSMKNGIDKLTQRDNLCKGVSYKSNYFEVQGIADGVRETNASVKGTENSRVNLSKKSSVEHIPDTKRSNLTKRMTRREYEILA